MLRRKKGISSWIIFMHDFRFHFISDYILFKPLISLMGQPDIVVEMAKPYLDIVAFSRSTYYFQAYLLMGNQILKVLCGLYHGNVINHQLFMIWIFPEMEL
jgi:MATE family multidrug resistance protein